MGKLIKHKGEIAQVRVCLECMNCLPLTDFGGESNTCVHCLEMNQIEARNKLNRMKARELFKQFVKANRPNRIDAPHISEVCACVVNELGGLERFAMELADDYRDARERSPGSSTVVKFGETILRMIRDSSAMRDTAPDAVNMSDEELASEMLAMCDKLATDKKVFSTDAVLQSMLEDVDGQKVTEDTGTSG